MRPGGKAVKGKPAKQISKLPLNRGANQGPRRIYTTLRLVFLRNGGALSADLKVETMIEQQDDREHVV